MAELFLRKIDIFSNLTEEELTIIRSVMKTREIDAGKTLFREGDRGDEIFIIESGRVAIAVELSGGQKLELSEMSGGDFFGEMSIFENAPRSATCYTKEKTVLHGLKGEDFYRLIKRHPEISIKIMYRMLNITTERLMKTSNFLADMVQWGEGARKRAITDEFTGLFNRRFLDDTLEERFTEARLKSVPLSLAMVDLDNFGKLNEKYGEERGNEVILSAVKIFREIFEEKDILVRYGGDEFTLLLIDKGPEEACRMCNQVCENLRALESGVKITSSIGLASHPFHAKSAEELKEKADKALYRAKELGRDRVVVAEK